MSIIKPFCSSKHPVEPYDFVGQEDLILKFSSKLTKCSEGTLQCFLITGVNQIGKSSFSEYIGEYAHDYFSFLNNKTVVDCKYINDIDFIVATLLSELLYGYIDNESFVNNMGLNGHILHTTWHFVKFSDEFVDEVKNNFATFLIKLIDNIPLKGIFLKIDTTDFTGEINDFSIFLSWFNDFINDLNNFALNFPISIALVLPKYKVDDFLNYKSIFKELFVVGELKRLNDNDVRNYFEKGFNKVKILVSDEIMNLLVDFSAGHPKVMNDCGNVVFSRYCEVYRYKAISGIKNKNVNSKEKFLNVISENYHEKFDLLLTGKENIDNLFIGIINKFSSEYIQNWEYAYQFNLSNFRLKLNDDENLIFEDVLRKLVDYNILHINEDNESCEFFDSTFLIEWKIWFLSYDNKRIKSNLKEFHDYNQHSLSDEIHVNHAGFLYKYYQNELK